LLSAYKFPLLLKIPYFGNLSDYTLRKLKFSTSIKPTALPFQRTKMLREVAEPKKELPRKKEIEFPALRG
jgi:hypothetical protein